jgi:phosphonopyruvate decarboxylase
VFVIDGDGAAMMHMGNMATIGSRTDAQLVHVILDNGSYDSTGGQPSISPQVDFMTIGKGCGYRHRYEVSELSEIKALLTRLVAEQTLPGQAQVDTHAVLVVIKIKPGSLSGLGRPTRSPTEIATRFQSFFQTN